MCTFPMSAHIPPTHNVPTTKMIKQKQSVFLMQIQEMESLH